MRRIVQAVLTAAVCSGAAIAQTSAPRDPISLPGDGLPNALATVLAPAASSPARPTLSGPPPAAVAPPLDLALKAAQLALAKCHELGFEVGVAVTDVNGGLVLGMQAPRASPGRIYSSVRKTLVAIEFGVPSSVVVQRLRSGDLELLKRTRPNMALGPGGFPLFRGGQLIGAIGVSGAVGGQNDELCAVAAVNAIKGKLG